MGPSTTDARSGSFHAARFMVPIQGLSEGTEWKFPAALGMTWLTDALFNLFRTDGEMVLLVALFVLADLVTGVVASRKAGRKIRSIGFRQTGVKVIEYTLLLAFAQAIGNKFEVVAFFGSTAYFFVCITEFKSIIENVTGSGSNARRVFKLLRREMERKADVVLDADEGRVYTEDTHVVETYAEVPDDCPDPEAEPVTDSLDAPPLR
jgi:phage-related holin